jgi:hypothetical protein
MRTLAARTRPLEPVLRRPVVRVTIEIEVSSHYVQRLVQGANLTEAGALERAAGAIQDRADTSVRWHDAVVAGSVRSAVAIDFR